ncbi:MAG: hypothetical protein F6K19_36845 [Cyanothece sp. SIO1E1]|nr:hypothetical protein [Cyanothece sp. SIO1E1]
MTQAITRSLTFTEFIHVEDNNELNEYELVNTTRGAQAWHSYDTKADCGDCFW